MKTELTLAQAHQMANHARALGAESRVRVTDYETTTGEVGTRYWVSLTLRDPNHGNTVLREMSEPCSEASIFAAIQNMKREIKERAKAVRARIRLERQMDKS